MAKTEICPLAGKECKKDICEGPIEFKSMNPAALAVEETVQMCGSVEAVTDDTYVMNIREDVIRMHERVLRHTRTAPFEEKLHFTRT